MSEKASRLTPTWAQTRPDLDRLACLAGIKGSWDSARPVDWDRQAINALGLGQADLAGIVWSYHGGNGIMGHPVSIGARLLRPTLQTLDLVLAVAALLRIGDSKVTRDASAALDRGLLRIWEGACHPLPRR